MSSPGMEGNIVRIQPLQFVHILDQNTNVVLLEEGPQTRVLKTHERLQGGPFPFIVVPPGRYCMINDPCIKYEAGKPTILKHGERDVRLHKAPFPLYPGESLVGAEKFGSTSKDYYAAVKKLPVIGANETMVLEARQDTTDSTGRPRQAGEVWQVDGPCTYIPTADVDTVNVRKAVVIAPNQSLRLSAKQDTVDRNGRQRKTGEEWLVHKEGAYLPGTFEQVVRVEKAIALTPDIAVHLRAAQTLVDSLGKERKAGEQWTVTQKDTETLFPEIGVEIKATVKRTVLNVNEYCVVVNPVDATGRPQLGTLQLRKGPTSFFLHQGETLREGIQKAHILQEDEAVVLQALNQFIDTSGKGDVTRQPGERWMVRGPVIYIPPIEVQVLDQRKAIPLAKNEGIYVRNIKSGKVRAVMGPQAYMVTEDEQLWEKKLSSQVEAMLQRGGGIGKEDIRKIAYFEQAIDPASSQGRDKTRVVTYRCPHNTACQVLNHAMKTARVIFGPNLVILGPDEEFNVLSLSAGKPKREDALQSLALMLGPDFITHIMEVETLDHARLQVKLAFNNYFKVDKSDPVSCQKIFSVPDFIGFSCRQIGSRIRGAVAQISFDEFHRHSAQAIRAAVFGLDKDGVPKPELVFDANDLVVTSIDVQSIEPVDLKMRDSLAKSVQMAIEIATSAIEQTAQHEARCLEQKARGELDRAKLQGEKEAERERSRLLELQATTAAIESTGQAVAEAQAKKESMIIECESHIVAATLKAEAEKIKHEALLDSQGQARTLELAYKKQMDDAEIHKSREHSNIEIQKFKDQIAAIGVETIKAISMAGPEHQVALLAGLGLESTLITDGNTPINLFNTVKGLVPVGTNDQESARP